MQLVVVLAGDVMHRAVRVVWELLGSMVCARLSLVLDGTILCLRLELNGEALLRWYHPLFESRV